jgi:molybdopterin molybdotransferase
MITVQEAPWHEARLSAAQAWKVLATESILIADGVGRTLAVDCLALCDLPTYATSAMDGFAVAGLGPWRIVGEVKAGRPMTSTLLEGTCVGIATGAVIPDGTFGIIRGEVAVVMYVKDKIFAPPHMSVRKVKFLQVREQYSLLVGSVCWQLLDMTNS